LRNKLVNGNEENLSNLPNRFEIIGITKKIRPA
jgi:hypothetical protein